MANLGIAIQIAAKDQGASAVIGGIKNGLAGLGSFAMLAGGAGLAGVTALAGGITAITMNAAGAADELVELSDKTGLSTTRLQEFQYIGEQTGTSLETVTGSLAKLVRSMDSAKDRTGPAADAFKALGISVTDSNGQLRSSETVFTEALDALRGVSNETQRDALAMAIFGKSAQELNPLIKAGSAGIKAMSEEAGSLGAVMSEESVKGLGALNDLVAGLKAGAAGLTGTFASAFEPVFTAGLGGLKAFLQDNMGAIKGFATEAAGVIGTTMNIITNPTIESVHTGGPFDSFYAGIVTLRDAVIKDGPAIQAALGRLFHIEGGAGVMDTVVGGIDSLAGAIDKVAGTIDKINAVKDAIGGFTEKAGGVGNILGTVSGGNSIQQMRDIADNQTGMTTQVQQARQMGSVFSPEAQANIAAFTASLGSFATATGDVVAGWGAMRGTMGQQINTPPNFTPGSPTPFETGLIGIKNAISQLNNTPLKLGGGSDIYNNKSDRLAFLKSQQSMGPGSGMAEYDSDPEVKHRFADTAFRRQQEMAALEKQQAYGESRRPNFGPDWMNDLRNRGQQSQAAGPPVNPDAIGRAVAQAVAAIPPPQISLHIDGREVAHTISDRQGASARALGRIGGHAPLR